MDTQFGGETCHQVGGPPPRSSSSSSSSLAVGAIEKFFKLVKEGNSDKLEEFLKENDGDFVNIFHKGDTPLCAAASRGHVEVTRCLLSHKANPNYTRENGRGPLYLASGNGFVDIVRILLEAGANPNISDRTNGETPVFMASWRDQFEAVRVLHEFHALLLCPKSGKSLLHLAAWRNKPDLAALLVELGVDIDMRDMNGATPLWAACSSGNIEFAEVLVKHGADVNAKNNQGESILQICGKAIMKAEGKGQEIIPLLFEKGAVIDSDETCKAVRNYAPDSDLLFYIADACTFELLEVALKLKQIRKGILHGVRTGILKINSKAVDDSSMVPVPWKELRGFLSEVDFRDCNLKNIPLGLAQLDPKRLSRIRFDGNPLRGHNRALKDLSPKQLLAALSLNLEGKMVPCREVKLMLVGEPAAGKTTLVRRLKGEVCSHKLSQTNISTDGIDLGEVVLHGIRFMCWDFGGQEIYRYTHQLFFSDNSLCLVLFDSRSPVDTIFQHISFWLRCIEQRAPGALALLVGTHASKIDPHHGKTKCATIWDKMKPQFSGILREIVLIDSVDDVKVDVLVKGLLVAAEEKLCEVPIVIEEARVNLSTIAKTINPPIVPRSIALRALDSIPSKELRILCLRMLHLLGKICIVEGEEGDENAFLPTFPSRSATQTGSHSSSLAEDFSDETSSTHSPRGNPLSISIMDRVPDDTISSSPSSHSASPPSSPSPSPSPSPTPIPSSPKSPSRPHSPSPSRPHSPLPSPRRVARTTSPSPKASRRLSLRSHFSSSPVTTFSEEGDVVKKSIPHPEGGEKPGAILTVHNTGKENQVHTISCQRFTLAEPCVVLDPKWLADVFKTVVTFKHTFVKNGVLLVKDLGALWSVDYEEHLHPSLLHFMIGLDILHPLDNERLLVPCLLPEARPQPFEVSHTQGLVIRRSFVLPKGDVLSSSIVARLLGIAMRIGGAVSGWLSGCIVKERNKGLVVSVRKEELWVGKAVVRRYSSNSRFSGRRVGGGEKGKVKVDVIHLIVAEEVRKGGRGAAEGEVTMKDLLSVFRRVEHNIRNVLDNYYHVEYFQIVPLNDCCSDYCELDKIKTALNDLGESVYSVNFGIGVRVDSLCPDFALSDLVPQIAQDSLTLKEVLGQGAFGRVFRGEWVKKTVKEIKEREEEKEKENESRKLWFQAEQPQDDPTTPTTTTTTNNTATCPATNTMINTITTLTTTPIGTTTTITTTTTTMVAIKELLGEEEVEGGGGGGGIKSKGVGSGTGSSGVGGEDIRREVYLMSAVHHPNIVKMCGICDDVQPPLLVLELLAGEELQQQLLDPVHFMKKLRKFSKNFDLKLLETMKDSEEKRFSSFQNHFGAAFNQLGGDEKWLKTLDNSSSSLSPSSLKKMGVALQELCEAYEKHWVERSRDSHLAVEKSKEECVTLYQENLESIAPVSNNIYLRIAADVTAGLNYLHSLTPPLIHRDIKSPNVFLTRPLHCFFSEEAVKTTVLAKIGDFGLSAFYETEMKSSERVSANPRYCAPEVLQSRTYSLHSDVYCCGLLLWEVRYRRIAFDTIQSGMESVLHDAVVSGERPIVEKNDQLDQLMARCWGRHPNSRPKAGEVYEEIREMAIKQQQEEGGLEWDLPPLPENHENFLSRLNPKEYFPPQRRFSSSRLLSLSLSTFAPPPASPPPSHFSPSTERTRRSLSLPISTFLYKYLAATQKDKDKGGGGGEGEGGGEIIVGDDILRRRPLYEKGRGEGEGEGGAGAGVSLGRGMTKTRTTHSPSKMRVSERRTRRESKKGSKRGSKRQERVMSYRREKVDFLVSASELAGTYLWVGTKCGLLAALDTTQPSLPHQQPAPSLSPCSSAPSLPHFSSPSSKPLFGEGFRGGKWGKRGGEGGGVGVTALAYSPSSHFLWCGSESGGLQVWNASPIEGIVASESMFHEGHVHLGEFKKKKSLLVMRGGCLEWNRPSLLEQRSKCVLLSEITIVSLDTSPHKFRIVTKQETYYFYAMSPEVAQSWVQKIRKNMEFLKEKWVLNQVSATEIHADENIYIKDLREVNGLVWSQDNRNCLLEWKVEKDQTGNLKGKRKITCTRTISSSSVPDPSLPFSLPYQSIIQIDMTEVWVATSDSIFSISDIDFVKKPFLSPLDPSLFSQNIAAIGFEKGGGGKEGGGEERVWVAEENGKILILDVVRREVTKSFELKTKKEEKDEEVVFIQQKEKEMWIGTRNGSVYQYSLEEEKLMDSFFVGSPLFSLASPLEGAWFICDDGSISHWG